EVKQVMGFSLEDFYDEEKGAGSWREKYEACINEPSLSHRKVAAIDIMKRIMVSQLETGTPCMFYRDEVNRMNNNPQEGMIYCSNLCTETTENMSTTQFLEEFIDDDGDNVIKYKSGDYVVCNLSSIHLGREGREGALERLISNEVRILDNVIDLHTLPIQQAQSTKQKYRAVCLRT